MNTNLELEGWCGNFRAVRETRKCFSKGHTHQPARPRPDQREREPSSPPPSLPPSLPPFLPSSQPGLVEWWSSSVPSAGQCVQSNPVNASQTFVNWGNLIRNRICVNALNIFIKWDKLGKWEVRPSPNLSRLLRARLYHENEWMHISHQRGEKKNRAVSQILFRRLWYNRKTKLRLLLVHILYVRYLIIN